jgi:iron-sulfur cluster repair protein YtfE (RIC family)
MVPLEPGRRLCFAEALDMATLQDELRADHTQLDEELSQLLAAAARGTPPEFERRWGDFESRLLAHMEAEERHIFPLFERAEAEEVRALREEHAELRSLLGEAAGPEPQPTLMQRAAARLARALKKHGGRENGLLYVLVDVATHEELERSVREFKARTFDSLRHASDLE